MSEEERGISFSGSINRDLAILLLEASINLFRIDRPREIELGIDLLKSIISYYEDIEIDKQPTCKKSLQVQEFEKRLPIDNKVFERFEEASMDEEFSIEDIMVLSGFIKSSTLMWFKDKDTNYDDGLYPNYTKLPTKRYIIDRILTEFNELMCSDEGYQDALSRLAYFIFYMRFMTLDGDEFVLTGPLY